MTLSLLSSSDHARWYQLTSWVFVTAQVHRAKMVWLSNILVYTVDANGVIWTLVNHPFISTANQPSACFVSAVARMTTWELHVGTFGRSKAWANLVRVRLWHSKLTYVVGWAGVLRIVFLSVCVNVSTFVVVAKTFYVWRCLLSLYIILIC